MTEVTGNILQEKMKTMGHYCVWTGWRLLELQWGGSLGESKVKNETLHAITEQQRKCEWKFTRKFKQLQHVKGTCHNFISESHPSLCLQLLSSSPYAMTWCPCCSKQCKTNSQLLQHMNHLSSKSIQFFDELIQILEAPKQERPRAHQQPPLTLMGF